MPPVANETALRAGILAACRTMQTQGLNPGMSGNISVRLDEENMLITPSATPYDLMTLPDMAVVSLDGAGRASGPKAPSSEWHFHAGIFRARPDVGAVVHTHARACTALAMARRGIPPVHYMIACFGGNDVRCGRYETFGTEALSAAVLEALEGRHACLMANHGMIACGRDLRQAMWRAVELEALAAQYLAALKLGPVLLTEDEMLAAHARFASYRP
jgi:L-fuculose-phosphate aldolase